MQKVYSAKNDRVVVCMARMAQTIEQLNAKWATLKECLWQSTVQKVYSAKTRQRVVACMARRTQTIEQWSVIWASLKACLRQSTACLAARHSACRSMDPGCAGKAKCPQRVASSHMRVRHRLIANRFSRFWRSLLSADYGACGQPLSCLLRLALWLLCLPKVRPLRLLKHLKAQMKKRLY